MFFCKRMSVNHTFYVCLGQWVLSRYMSISSKFPRREWNCHLHPLYNFLPLCGFNVNIQLQSYLSIAVHKYAYMVNTTSIYYSSFCQSVTLKLAQNIAFLSFVRFCLKHADMHITWIGNAFVFKDTFCWHIALCGSLDIFYFNQMKRDWSKHVFLTSY